MVEDYERGEQQEEDRTYGYAYILSGGISRYQHFFPNPLAAQLEARPNYGDDVLRFTRKGFGSFFSMSFAEVKAAYQLVESLEARMLAAGRAR